MLFCLLQITINTIKTLRRHYGANNHCFYHLSIRGFHINLVKKQRKSLIHVKYAFLLYILGGFVCFEQRSLFF